MLSYSADVSAPLARFERVQTRIDEFGTTDIPAELTAWQREDMHRQYPNTETDSAAPTQGRGGGTKSAQTRIWPRSRASSLLRPHHKRSIGRPLGRPKGVKTGQGQKRTKSAKPFVTGSHRPILRPELKTKLYQRMTALMQTKITWA